MTRWVDPLRRRFAALRTTLGTRLLLVLVSVVSASTIFTVALQDSALRGDLERAARTRLDHTARFVGHLVETHLAGQRDRLGAISSTPQFLANLESEHTATLSHYATELAERHGADVIAFVSPGGDTLAASGDEALRAATRRAAVCEAQRGAGEDAAVDADVATLLAHDGALYAVASTHVRGPSESAGRLVAATRIDAARLAAWSDLVRARVTIEPSQVDTTLSACVRPAGTLQVRVSTTFDTERLALANSRRWLLLGGLIGLALGSAASIVLARSLVRPIQRIQEATRRIGDGDTRFRLDEGRRDEVGDVARAINGMLDGLERNVRDRVRAEERLGHVVRHDALTGLGNRRFLREHVATALGSSRAVAVLACGLERFKVINESLGSHAGDAVLVEFARRLRQCTQGPEPVGEPARERVAVTRSGDAAFTLVFTEPDGRDEIVRLAQSVLDAIAEPFAIDGEDVAIHVHLGIARAPDDATDAETLLRNADMAMAHAKAGSGDRHAFYADSMQEIAVTRRTLETRLHDALSNDEFEVLYQPKLDLHTRRVGGVEALVRWRDPERGEISPAEFIPIAEESGAIVRLGDWVLQRAIDQALAWQAAGLPPLRVGVNVSARQIDATEDFADHVAAHLARSGLDPTLLDLEITEGALLADERAGIAVFERLRRLGVGLSLDDFGTGYSSLSYLQRLPVDTLKIDRSFLHDPDANGDNEVLIESIIEMAKVLDLRVVVEGVETMRQRRFLERIGCDEIQGFLISPPVRAKEAATIVRRRKPRTKKTASRA